MSENNNYFMIFNTSELTTINFDEVLETSINSVRKSIDKTTTLVNWVGNITPDSVNSLLTKQGPYTYDEILTILSGPDWSPQKPFPYT